MTWASKLGRTAPRRQRSALGPSAGTNRPRDDRLRAWQSLAPWRPPGGVAVPHHSVSSLVCTRKASPGRRRGSYPRPARAPSYPKKRRAAAAGLPSRPVSERPARPRYDTTELRLRMAIGLSAASLREVGTRLGAPPSVGALGSTDGIARGARALRREGRSSARTTLRRGAGRRGSARGVARAPRRDRRSCADRWSCNPRRARGGSSRSRAARGLAPRSLAALPVRPRGGLDPPGRGAPAAPAAKSGLDPRLLVAVAGFMALAALFAFLAGRITAGDDEEEPAPSAQAALRAATALQTSLGNVARTCKVSADPPLEGSLLRTAYDVCGVTAERARPHALPSLDEVPTAKPSEPAGPLVPRPTRSELPRATTACVDQCNTTHAGCRRACGAEPTDASAYADYQSCLGKCLKASSPCRQACAAP